MHLMCTRLFAFAISAAAALLRAQFCYWIIEPNQTLTIVNAILAVDSLGLPCCRRLNSFTRSALLLSLAAACEARLTNLNLFLPILRRVHIQTIRSSLSHATQTQQAANCLLAIHNVRTLWLAKERVALIYMHRFACKFVNVIKYAVEHTKLPPSAGEEF